MAPPQAKWGDKVALPPTVEIFSKRTKSSRTRRRRENCGIGSRAHDRQREISTTQHRNVNPIWPICLPMHRQCDPNNIQVGLSWQGKKLKQLA